jgi:hypothetical protein
MMRGPPNFVAAMDVSLLAVGFLIRICGRVVPTGICEGPSDPPAVGLSLCGLQVLRPVRQRIIAELRF